MRYKDILNTQDIHVSIGHSLSELVFYYSLLVNICDFNAAELFLLEPKGRGGRTCAGLFYGIFSFVYTVKKKFTVTNTPSFCLTLFLPWRGGGVCDFIDESAFLSMAGTQSEDSSSSTCHRFTVDTRILHGELSLQ
jgi:hypothetical protein